MTRDGLTNPLPRVNVALCVKCHTLTETPVPVRWIQSNSGPGTTLYACPDHWEELAPGPMPGELERDV
ncbi:hypothetical protein ACWFR1_03165 [Streptomyces sp. NPDC055103]